MLSSSYPLELFVFDEFFNFAWSHSYLQYIQNGWMQINLTLSKKTNIRFKLIRKIRFVSSYSQWPLNEMWVQVNCFGLEPFPNSIFAQLLNSQEIKTAKKFIFQRIQRRKFYWNVLHKYRRFATLQVTQVLLPHSFARSFLSIFRWFINITVALSFVGNIFLSFHFTSCLHEFLFLLQFFPCSFFEFIAHFFR